jgi:hypothetical protein
MACCKQTGREVERRSTPLADDLVIRASRFNNIRK